MHVVLSKAVSVYDVMVHRSRTVAITVCFQVAIGKDKKFYLANLFAIKIITTVNRDTLNSSYNSIITKPL